MSEFVKSELALKDPSIWHCLLPWLFAVVFLTQQAKAMSPPPSPRDHRLYSANQRYFAEVSKDGHTTVERVRRGWFAKRLWTTPHYFENALVSDDGSFLVFSDDYVLIPLQRDATVVEIYSADGSVRRFPLKSFAPDLQKLSGMNMGGGRRWRDAIRLTGDLLQIDSFGRVFELNAKTGKVRMLTPRPRNGS